MRRFDHGDRFGDDKGPPTDRMPSAPPECVEGEVPVADDPSERPTLRSRTWPPATGD